jgi:hypothetical protein
MSGDVMGFVRREIKMMAHRLERKIEQAQADVVRWVIAVAIVQVAVLVTALRLLP